MTKARYIERDNEIVYRPPYEQAGTFLSMWPLASSTAKQQVVLDAHLNRPMGEKKKYVFQSFSPYVFLVLADIEKVTSKADSDKNYGFIPEQDICVWMLIEVLEKQPDQSSKHYCYAWYVPYIWVTNADTMATGREVYGYPKAIARGNVPNEASHFGPFAIEALVIDKKSPEAQVTWQPVVAIQHSAAVPEVPTTFEAGPLGQKLAVDALVSSTFGDDKSDDRDRLLAQLKDGLSLPMVFLKQFRDVEPTADQKSDTACYQAILQSSATVNAFQGGWYYKHGWEIELKAYDSVNIARHLLVEGTEKYDAPWGFHFSLSFSMDHASIMWRHREDAQ